MSAQTGLLLAQARHVSAVVVDPEGKPVAEAWIDHAGFGTRGPRAPRTDSEGRFALDTRAPVVVIRKAGFRSEVLRTPDASEVRITLQKAVGVRALQVCSYCKTCEGLEGWGAWFFFPMTPEVTAGPQGADIDYGARGYYTDTQQGRKAIRHGAGPLWSDGMPFDEDVWRSVEYRETSFEFRGVTIIDARGKLPNGKCWRCLGRPGESADYRDVDEATARILDRVLDGVCLTSGPYRPY